jgi:hypothetical protein
MKNHSDVEPRTMDSKKISLKIILHLSLIAGFSIPSIHLYAQEANCTMVIGFSQTADWYLAPAYRNTNPDEGAIFESIIDNDRWQLKWANGAGVNVYADPDNPAWDSLIVSPCTENSAAPERIVYMISGPHGEDVAGWIADIETALANIREKIPSAEIIALQPVIGAPADADGDECFTPQGQRVRASWQATPINSAITDVAERFNDVIEGATTRLLDCNGYTDFLGHISNGESVSGASYAAVTTGLFYRDFDFRP